MIEPAGKRRGRDVALPALLAAMLLLAGCSRTTTGRPSSNRTTTTRPGSSSAPASIPAPLPSTVVIAPATGAAHVDPAAGIVVRADHGTLTSVTARCGTSTASGTYGVSRVTWRSTAPLPVSSRCVVTATAIGADSRPVTRTSRFQTLTPRNTVTASIAEQSGAIYGVGMPIQVSFSQPITHRAAIERAMQLTTSKPVVGAWYWLDSENLQFRPRDYWPAYTKVSVLAHLDGVPAAPGVYGAANVRSDFAIGESLIVVASTATHRLLLYRDGKLFHNWPISTGRPGDDTPNGTYLTIDKANPVEMRPAGIAPGQPGYYDLWVPWSVRFTWSGDYLHDAWWSVDQQGYTNVSHGCVNLPPAAAETYYNLEVSGDPVTITGSPAAGDPSNGWTDWFYSWSYLLARSAMHDAVLAGPTGSKLINPATAPASTATAPLGRPAPDNANASA